MHTHTLINIYTGIYMQRETKPENIQMYTHEKVYINIYIITENVHEVQRI